MCKALMPGDEESMNDEAIWEALPVSFLDLVIYNMEVKCLKLAPSLLNAFHAKQNEEFLMITRFHCKSKFRNFCGHLVHSFIITSINQ